MLHALQGTSVANKEHNGRELHWQNHSCMYLHKMNAPESHHHPQTSPEEPTGWTAHGLHRHYLLSEKSFLPYLLSSSSSQSKFSVMSMSGEAMLCWAGQINVSLSAAHEEMQAFPLPKTAPSTWLINSHVPTDVVWTSLATSRCVCIAACGCLSTARVNVIFTLSGFLSGTEVAIQIRWHKNRALWSCVFVYVPRCMWYQNVTLSVVETSIYLHVTDI